MFIKQVRKIISKMTTSVKIPPINIGIEPILLNMPQELYSDAIYFRNQANKTVEHAIRSRYKRVSLICFCASTEAWLNTELRGCISQKTTRHPYEQEILNFMEDITINRPPDKYSSIRDRLYNCAGFVFTGQYINWSTHRITAFENYIELSKARNMIAHYVTKYREIVYDQHFDPSQLSVTVTNSIDNAPKVVFDLCQELHSLNSTVAIPSWAVPA